ncbi:hypothetical protein SAMN04487905_103412 [Actinopolyspora xinjiangensis]|uniref:Uncharacterized protein n=1 Tax=Actinopolyspora xinjiangensis TaxID=405564 RepID=A0A1H0S6Y2_9ACTN|nr:DUF6245 family protein [Actinopolyspora xinjiangensis]SDP37523.1 hypothetical protein SAMN04487905_103412 [Actinopolyspora xinjiangensis]
MTTSASSSEADQPASVGRLATALQALDHYRGTNTPDEHTAAAERLGGEAVYRAYLANALLGAAQLEALLNESVEFDAEQRSAIYLQQQQTAGVTGDQTSMLEFLRWQLLRIASPLRENARTEQAGPVPVAAAQTAEGLDRLLAVSAASHTLTDQADIDSVAEQLDTAHQALSSAVENIDRLRALTERARSGTETEDSES